MNMVNWQKLRVLKTVLEKESFSGAARQLGISQPTVSRQIKSLEDELGETLLDVTPDGVMATAAALRLSPILDEMMRAAEQIQRPTHQLDATPAVRIACGPWIANFLSYHLSKIVGDPVARHIDITSSILFADIPRREADIAIRTKRPESGRLRVKRLPNYSYAVYGKKTLVERELHAYDKRRFSRFHWAMLAQELDHFATSQWLMDQGVINPIARFSASINLLDAVKSGDVLAVIPCFAGDREPDLVRVSDPFIPGSGQIWMVLPDDVNRRPHIRQTADALVALFNENFDVK